MKVSISPGRLARHLMGVAIVLSLISVCLGLYGDVTGHRRLMGFGRLFNVGAESNIPTWYSASALLICAALFGLIASGLRSRGDRFARHWRILAFALLYLSADEACMIHETIGATILRLHLPHAVAQFGWVIPVSIPVVVFVLMYIPFLRALPRDTRRLFLTAGFVYVSGAFGLEAAGGLWRTAFGETGTSYTLMATAEEFLEMTGVVILAYALVRHIEAHMHGAQIRIGEGGEATPVAAPVEADLSTAA